MAIEELRNNRMMARLLDTLDSQRSIGHYGRLVLAIVGLQFAPDEEVAEWLVHDPDTSEEEVLALLEQVKQRGYSPPKREKLLEYHSQQDFPLFENPEDPDEGNLYRDLKFPDAVYRHITEYHEQQVHAEHAQP